MLFSRAMACCASTSARRSTDFVARPEDIARTRENQTALVRARDLEIFRAELLGMQSARRRDSDGPQTGQVCRSSDEAASPSPVSVWEPLQLRGKIFTIYNFREQFEKSRRNYKGQERNPTIGRPSLRSKLAVLPPSDRSIHLPRTPSSVKRCTKASQYSSIAIQNALGVTSTRD